MVPDDLDLITDGQFGEIVEGIEGAEGIGPGDVTPAVGGENHRLSCVFRGSEVSDAPNAGFEDRVPVVALVDLAADTDFVDDEAVIFGEGGVEGGKGGVILAYAGIHIICIDSRFSAKGRTGSGNDREARNDNLGRGGADGGGEGVGGSRGEAVEDVGPDGGDRENDGQDPKTDAEVNVYFLGHIFSISFCLSS